MTQSPVERYDLAVIGAGMSGMAAALFAAQRGLSTILIGSSGGLLFASGLLDLLAVHPVPERRLWSSPYDALAALARDQPEHPLARIDPSAIRMAFKAFASALASAGLDYAPLVERNSDMLTSMGTVKTSFGVPLTMVAGIAALEARPPCLLLDFRGLREFSARQITATLADRWPQLRHQRVVFPGFDAIPEVNAVHLARALEIPETRDRLMALIRPLLGGARVLGLPAVLGLGRSREVHVAFEAGLGVPVFEIPTMPPSVPGLRLQEALEKAVSVRRVRRRQASVRALTFDNATALLDLDVPGWERISASAVVLATGRFNSRGLTADRHGVRESLLGLPVQQPASRDEWHQRDFLDLGGHAINRTGLRTDGTCRPLDTTGKPAWPNLFAIGSVLANQDWTRAKCGSGLAIATAWAAIEQLARQLRGSGMNAKLG